MDLHEKELNDCWLSKSTIHRPHRLNPKSFASVIHKLRHILVAEYIYHRPLLSNPTRMRSVTNQAQFAMFRTELRVQMHPSIPADSAS